LQNILKGSQEKVELNIYNNGVLSQADSLPTVSVYDADNDASPIAGYNNVPVIDVPEAGVYKFLITPALTQVNRVIEVKWFYSINGIQTSETNYYSIDTPYSTPSDIIDFLQYGSNPAEINYHSISEINAAEKVARTIIEGYTGQIFTHRYGTQEVFGVGSDAIHVTERMLTIDKMWEDDQLVIDTTTDPVYNTFGFPVELTQTNFTVRIVYGGWDIRYDNQVDPTVLYYGRFRQNARYKFEGQIGYKYVPDEIKLASMLLVNDILSNDYNWRNKYLSKVNLSEVSFEMEGGAFNGTGNITVDNILDQYRHTNVVII
jgi:hypothetical protein